MAIFFAMIELIIVFVLLILILLNNSTKTHNSSIGTGQTIDKKELYNNLMNEISYQRYAKFYDNAVPHDERFDEKMNKIRNLIEIDKIMDIRKIAEKSGCTYEECVLKIKYLKNKRQIGLYYIDNKTEALIPCSPEDFKLIEKYKPYIYYNHLQPIDIAKRMPGVTYEILKETEEKIYKEIVYLYEKDLLNGIKINEVDKKIIYYTIEKNKIENDLITISCPNCGALNDLNRGSKTRCEYCDSIIIDNIIEEEAP